MRCPYCHAKINENTDTCPNCNAFFTNNNIDVCTSDSKIENHNGAGNLDDDIRDILFEAGYDRENISSDNLYKSQSTEKKLPPPKKVELVLTDEKEDYGELADDKDDESDSFESIAHNLKLLMAVISALCVLCFSVWGIMGLFNQKDAKNEMNNYLLSLNEANDMVDAGDYKSAIRTYEEIIATSPSVSAAYYALSKVYYLTGNDEMAKNVLEQGYLNTGDPLLLS